MKALLAKMIIGIDKGITNIVNSEYPALAPKISDEQKLAIKLIIKVTMAVTKIRLMIRSGVSFKIIAAIGTTKINGKQWVIQLPNILVATINSNI